MHLGNIKSVTSIQILFFSLLLYTNIQARDTLLVDFRSFSDNIISLVDDGKGIIWFNTGTGLYQFDGNTIRWVKPNQRRETLIFWKGKLTTCEAQYRLNKEIIQVDWADEWAKFLPPGSARHVHGGRDKTGKYWVTQGQHLYGFRISDQFDQSHRGRSLRGILQTPHGLLVSTYSGIFLNQKQILPDSIYSQGNVILRNNHELLFPYGGISSYNFHTGTLKKFPIRSDLKQKGVFEFMNVRKAKSGIWIASAVGLLKLQNDTLVPTSFTVHTEDVTIHGQQLYLATKNGIYQSDGKKFSRVTAFPVQMYHSIQSIDDTWWATSQKGIWTWRENQPQAIRLYKNQQLGSLETYSLVKDSKGYYWASTVSGIVRFKPGADRYEHFLQQIEFNKRSVAQTKDSIYFGSTSGLYYFHPASFQEPPISAPSAPFPKWILFLIASLILSLSVSLVLFFHLRKARRIIDAQQNVSTNVPDPFIARLEQYVEDNLSTVTVDSLSEFSGLSRRGLYRALEASYGLKPGDLIRNIKRKRIKQLQDQYPDISAEELAEKVGYSLIHLTRLLER